MSNQVKVKIGNRIFPSLNAYLEHLNAWCKHNCSKYQLSGCYNRNEIKQDNQYTNHRKRKKILSIIKCIEGRPIKYRQHKPKGIERRPIKYRQHKPWWWTFINELLETVIY
jgi:hypothetical protein